MLQIYTNGTATHVLNFSSSATVDAAVQPELLMFIVLIYKKGHGFHRLKDTFGFYVALRPRRRDDLLGTGTEWEGGQGDWLDHGNRPKKTGETVDRRQNNGSVKAVSPRHCPATCALRNCSFNCCAGQSH